MSAPRRAAAGGPVTADAWRIVVYCQHCRMEAKDLAPICPAVKSGRHSTMSRWARVSAQVVLL